ncbi:MAG: hypothetical protein WCX46_02300 [Candidatus Paceibacterota bacterium]
MTQKEIKIRKASDKFVRWIGSPYSLLVHTIFFAVMITLAFSDIGFDKIMLVLTTIVSLEAIYLSIFIQMTVNKHTEELEDVSEDIDEIQEDVDEIQKDVDEIQEDFEEIQKEEDEEDDETEKIIISNRNTLTSIEDNLGKLVEEVIALKKEYKKSEEVKN